MLVAPEWKGGIGLPASDAKRLTIGQANWLIERSSHEHGKKKIGPSTVERAERTDPEKLEAAREYQRRNREWHDPASATVATSGGQHRVDRSEAQRLRAAAKAAGTSEV